MKLTVKALADWLRQEVKPEDTHEDIANNLNTLTGVIGSSAYAVAKDKIGMTAAEYRTFATNTLSLIEKTFDGNAKAAVDYIKKHGDNPTIADREYNQFVTSGDAHKFVQDHPEPKVHGAANDLNATMLAMTDIPEAPAPSQPLQTTAPPRQDVALKPFG